MLCDMLCHHGDVSLYHSRNKKRKEKEKSNQGK